MFLKFEILRTTFYDVSSSNLGGSFYAIGIDGFVNFTTYRYTHSGNCGTVEGGNVFYVKDSILAIDCNTAFECWNSSNCGDSFFDISGDNYQMKNINLSYSEEKHDGGFINNLHGSGDVEAIFLQQYECKSNIALSAENGKSPGKFICSKVNLINNTYYYVLLWMNGKIIRLEDACVFGNTGGTSYTGTPEIVNCFSNADFPSFTKTATTSHLFSCRYTAEFSA